MIRDKNRLQFPVNCVKIFIRDTLSLLPDLNRGPETKRRTRAT